MQKNPLQLNDINVAIVGSGAIGCAMARSLLSRPEVSSLYLLCRNPGKQGLPEGATLLHLDARDDLPAEAAAQHIASRCERLHLLVNTVGVLHDSSGLQPEKRLAQLTRDSLLNAFQLNAMLLPALAQAFGALLRHDQPAMLASLSARVGSIGDNRSGGWYSYRTSKAAHNMLLRTIANEWRISHANSIVVALHPGTVRSQLSAPFVSARYPHRVLEPEESAGHLLDVMASLTTADSGSFYDWQGELIPW